MAQMILEECGYRVLLANNGKEALDVWERHQNSIDLLFTDMVMPAGMSGMELANKLLANAKQLRMVFASGYTVDDISTEFLTRNNNARFLQKPYTRVNLARAVREALDGDGKQRTSSALMAKVGRRRVISSLNQPTKTWPPLPRFSRRSARRCAA
jgi:CheY-like chemotaxis protein